MARRLRHKKKTVRTMQLEAVKRAEKAAFIRPNPDPSDGVDLSPEGSPLDYMLAVMRDPKASKARRDRMALSAAKFFHKDLTWREEKKITKKSTNIARAESFEKNGRWSGVFVDDDAQQ